MYNYMCVCVCAANVAFLIWHSMNSAAPFANKEKTYNFMTFVIFLLNSTHV